MGTKQLHPVIFDMDGVIFDSERLLIDCWKIVADRHGVPDIEATLSLCLGVNVNVSRQIYFDRYGDDFPLDEYKEDLKKKLAEQKEQTAKTEFQNAVLAKAVENAKMDIPEAMIKYQAQQMVNQYAQQMQMQGLSMETYTQITGQTMDDLADSMKDQAESRIRNSLVLEAIAKAEGVEISQDEIDAEVKRMADGYGMTEEQIRGYLTDTELENIKKDLEVQKALELITA